MSLITVENFSLSTNTADYNSLNYEFFGPAIGYCAPFGKNAFGSFYFSRLLPLAYTRLYMGARVYVGPGSNGTGYLCFISGPSNNLNTTQIGLSFNMDGSISVFGGTGGAAIATSNSSVFNLGVPFYVEIGVNCATSGGNVHVRVNQITVIDAEGIDTNPTSLGYIQGYGANAGNSGQGPYITDIYLCDGNTAILNNFLGDVNINSVLCNSNYNVQFSPYGGGNNWQNTRVINPNPTVNYNGSNIITQTDLFTVNSLPIGTQNVFAVMSRTLMDGESAAVGVQQILQSGNIQSRGNIFYLNNSFTYYDTIFPVNPATNAAWTVNSVNTMITGYQLVV